MSALVSFWVGSCSVFLPSTSASLSPAVGASVSKLVPAEGRLQACRVPPGLVPLCSTAFLAGFFMKGSRMELTGRCSLGCTPM